jgi:hypothetical protein
LNLEGSRIAGRINAGRAKLSGSALLGKIFVDGSDVNFLGAEIGGSLQCAGAKIRPKNGQDGLICTGTNIGRDVLLNTGFECEGRVYFNLSRIGGNLDCNGGKFRGVKGRYAIVATGATISGDVNLNSPAKDELFEAKGTVQIASARIGGNVIFWGAVIRNGKDQTINADNAKIDGSFSFGGGFLAEGEVSLYGAEISKDLDFSGGTFDTRDPNGFVINASGSSVSGNVIFQPTEPTEDELQRYPFQSFGIVSLSGAKCGAMYCSGGIFYNRNSMDKPDSQASAALLSQPQDECPCHHSSAAKAPTELWDEQPHARGQKPVQHGFVETGQKYRNSARSYAS